MCLLWAHQVTAKVLWHGMGDAAHSAGMIEFARLCQEVHPGMFVHSIYIYDDIDKDHRAGFVCLSFY